MSHEWIKAALALEYVSDDLLDYSARLRICERAHAGLIAAKAERIIWSGKEERDRLIGKGFWWAEGREALNQDWCAGDFSTWIDQRVKVQAFGVSFDFTALSELVPADKQAAALRRISVIADEDWISASDLFRAMSTKGGPFAAKLLEACQLGQIAGRAMRAKRFRRGGLSEPDHHIWGAIEWDIPLCFWRDFVTSDHAKIDWRLDKFSGRGGNKHHFEDIELQGVHFHRSGLPNLGLVIPGEAEATTEQAKRGRKPEYDWPAATAAIWGQVYRGELIPKAQADIERAFQAYLAKGDKEPSESTVRPYAQPIWEQVSKA